jgi:hypothetical protein
VDSSPDRSFLYSSKNSLFSFSSSFQTTNIMRRRNQQYDYWTSYQVSGNALV